MKLAFHRTRFSTSKNSFVPRVGYFLFRELEIHDPASVQQNSSLSEFKGATLFYFNCNFIHRAGTVTIFFWLPQFIEPAL